MNKFRNNPFVFIIALAAFCACLLYGILFGSEHPNIFFWSFVIVFAFVIIVFVTPTTKDAIILVAGMILLAIIGEIVNNLIPEHWNEFVKFIVQAIALSPIYLPLYNHFIKMVIKSKKE